MEHGILYHTAHPYSVKSLVPATTFILHGDRSGSTDSATVSILVVFQHSRLIFAGTWNALNLGSDLTDDNLYGALDELAQNDISITNLIIDDGWQAVTKGPVRGWKTFEANKDAFADGLKAIVSKLRKSFPDIDHIAVWHAMHGYWGGISPDGQIAQTYKTIEVHCGSPYNQKLHIVDKEDVDRFYNDFYKFLADSGIDSVKTDVQHILDCIIDTEPRRDLITSYLDAWTLASLRQFNFRTISCMSQFPQGIFHSHMHQSRPTLIVRNSDEFFPNKAASHAWHIWANAHNSLFARYMNVLPDWDMFQTKHEYGGFHAAARCVSGGPIYITDVPGEHDLNVIRAMTAVTIRGKTVILRPSVIGRSVTHYVGFDTAQLCKVGSYHGKFPLTLLFFLLFFWLFCLLFFLLSFILLYV